MGSNFKYFMAGTLVFLAAASFSDARAAQPPGHTMAEVLAAAPPSDWRAVDPANTLYVELPTGRVVIELDPRFAPLHIANIKKLARAHYFDSLGVIRVQDDYVSQWGDPTSRHPLPPDLPKVAPEFDRPLTADVPFTRLPDGDVYAPEVGFTDGFPAARAPALHRTWLAHCYGMVGIGRDVDAESGSGAEMYVVIGHAPRHLDRNVTLVGRVLKGVELLSALPRGTKTMGFYADDQRPLPLRAVRVASDVPAAERTPMEVLRTDTASFAAVIESRRNRPEDWFKVPAGKIDLCNVPLPVRETPAH
ncbi:MAG TPA: peptidylprolyl isomerase [Steroidobacteraceae bacterium]|jgi:peptidylprolyl isomerase|nr:peptidylprolyl isomerase [Steroidobacteraceae bacterium]